MRTYFIATGWNNRPVSQHSRALAHALADRGHRVVLLVPGNVPEARSPSTNPAVLNWPSPRPRHFRDVKFLFRLARKYRPDCMVANFGATNVMTLVGYLTRVKGRVDWYHTLSSQLEADSSVSAIRGWIQVIRRCLVYKLATHVVCNSQAALEDVKAVYRVPDHKCHVFHNALEDPIKRYGLTAVDRQPNRLVCVGRLEPSKGQDVLIKSIAILKDQFPDIRVDFVGKGSSKQAYVALAENLGVKENCHFRGSLSHMDVLHSMALATLTVVPSRHEAFGLVNIESLAAGTPVVGSHTGGISEIVRSGVDGFLVTPGDSAALAERIAELLQNPALREAMAVQARKRFLAIFEQQLAVSKQADWFESLSGKNESKQPFA